MPTFDGRGLVPEVPPEGQEATAPVELSSDDSRGGGEEDEEEEERESESTAEGTGETSPWRRANILRTLLDDDEVVARREEEDPPVIPKKDRSGLISRGTISAQALPEATSSPSGAPSSVSGPLEAVPRTKRLTGFKLGKRSMAYTAIDQ